MGICFRAGAFLVVAMLSCVMVACSQGGESRAPSEGQQDVADVIQEQAAMEGRDDVSVSSGDQASGGTGGSGETGSSDSTDTEGSEILRPFVGDGSIAYDETDVDIDLTTMGADMVYATVFDMMSYPEDYRGKVIRMSGLFAHSYLESTGKDYFFVIVEDATACCAQGLEFVWGDGSHAYPEEYPEEGQDVTAVGVFDIYSEGDTNYVHLVDASLVPAK